MKTLTEVFQSKKYYDAEKTTIFIDDDIVFIENMEFEMHPADVLIEALELLGFDVNFV